jgi:hypothetical protein
MMTTDGKSDQDCLQFQFKIQSHPTIPGHATSVAQKSNPHNIAKPILFADDTSIIISNTNPKNLKVISV